MAVLVLVRLMVAPHTPSGTHSLMVWRMASAGMWAVLVSLGVVVQASTAQNLQALRCVVLLVVAEVEAGQLAGMPYVLPPDTG